MRRTYPSVEAAHLDLDARRVRHPGGRDYVETPFARGLMECAVVTGVLAANDGPRRGRFPSRKASVGRTAVPAQRGMFLASGPSSELTGGVTMKRSRVLTVVGVVLLLGGIASGTFAAFVYSAYVDATELLARQLADLQLVTESGNDRARAMARVLENVSYFRGLVELRFNYVLVFGGLALVLLAAGIVLLLRGRRSASRSARPDRATA